MTIILRPPGRGNWQTTVVTIEQSKHAPVPIEVYVGQVLTLGTRVFRVCRVYAS